MGTSSYDGTMTLGLTNTLCGWHPSTISSAIGESGGTTITLDDHPCMVYFVLSGGSSFSISYHNGWDGEHHWFLTDTVDEQTYTDTEQCGDTIQSLRGSRCGSDIDRPNTHHW